MSADTGKSKVYMKRSKVEKHRGTVYLSVPVWKRLRWHADRNARTASAQMEVWLRERIAEEEERL